MTPEEVPPAWVDAAMTGTPSSLQGDIRSCLASAYDVIREDLLWEVAGDISASVTCACGMSWFLIPSQGPDPGHGRERCESAADATLRIKGVELQIHQWTFSPLADWAGETGRFQISGWLRGEVARDADLYNDARLERADLPGRKCPTGQPVDVEVKGHGDGRGLFLKVQWSRRP